MPRISLTMAWLGVGCVLIAASIAQPIVAGRLEGKTLTELMQPPPGAPFAAPELPPAALSMFSGMMLNIEFALAFSAVKLALGASVIWAALNLPRSALARTVLTLASWIFIAAFAAIASTFAITIGLAALEADAGMAAPYALMAAFGALIALAPIILIRKGMIALKAMAANPA